MKCIQRAACIPADCSPRLRAMYADAHASVALRGQFHAALGGCEADVDALGERIAEEQMVANATIEKKSKKGTDVRWKYECEVVDDRLLDVAHLLAPAILIEYGVGETYGELSIDAEKQKTATATLAFLVDPEFIFWATHMRVIYRLVYRDAFSAVQADGHHAAPALAGQDGLPMRWAAAMRSAVVQREGQRGGRVSPTLNPVLCAPLVQLLDRHPLLGGHTGQCATEAAQDFLDQAEHIEHYFERWRTLEGLPHALALEHVVCGPLPEYVYSERLGELGASYVDLMPRVPTESALHAAQKGLDLFRQACEADRRELPGTLTWLLFSPTTRDGSPNPVYDQTRAFAVGEINPLTGRAYPYRCWHELAQVLVAGGAKYCPSTSAQVESLFTALPRQQGASKVHISQPQISFEARSPKNPTMAALTEPQLTAGWEEAKAVQRRLLSAGFWTCDVGIAADRKLAQKLNEELELPAADGDDDDVVVPEVKYNVQRIVRSWAVRGKQMYEVKWEGWDKSHNTEEPEEHLVECKLLVPFWRAKKNKAQVDRVTSLQEAALAERAAAESALRQRPAQVLGQSTEPAPHAGALADAVAGRPAPPARQPAADATQTCIAAYDTAHRVLSTARSLVFSTKTSGLAGCVLNIGWVLVDANGVELAAYERLWRLPDREHIQSASLREHEISKDRLLRDGVETKPELTEFFRLVSAALAGKVRIVAYNASFNVARLNHTAAKHGLPPQLRSVDMLCTMHGATRHCELRKRGTKSFVAPGKEELYRILFARPPPECLHTALPDCRVMLACLMEGLERKWW